MSRRRIASALILIVFILTAACADKAEDAEGAGSGQTQLSVVVTFDALYEIAMAVGGERASVRSIMPDGMEAHDFEPQAKDLAMLDSADVFIVNGLGLDSWAEKAANAASGGKLPLTDTSAGTKPIPLSGGEDEGHYDPHIWLSPVCAATMAENIRDAFCAADPEGKERYHENCSGFTRSLSELYSEYAEKLRALDNRTIVTGHAVFAYLCRDFNLVQNSVEGVFAEGEPSARELVELIEFCIENGVTTILTENLSSPLIAETLAAEAGAEVKVIYTMEGSEDGLSFLDRMEMNLEAVYLALE